ncbi:MAG: peptidase dimerization domain-containing protein, partial [Chloroflexi bacterium]|nr:peptidase dimerization domain-containing protein [Chloroflexota bacterium]
QTHAAAPWMGVDPIVTASQIVVALQTVVSRQVDLLQGPSIVSIGTINGGVRNNIIPASVEMTGTIRTLVPETRTLIHERVKRVAERVAESMGATAEVTITKGYPVTFNDAHLAEIILVQLAR